MNNEQGTPNDEYRIFSSLFLNQFSLFDVGMNVVLQLMISFKLHHNRALGKPVSFLYQDRLYDS